MGTKKINKPIGEKHGTRMIGNSAHTSFSNDNYNKWQKYRGKLLSRCHPCKWMRSEGRDCSTTVRRNGAQPTFVKSLEFTFNKVTLNCGKRKKKSRVGKILKRKKERKKTREVVVPIDKPEELKIFLAAITGTPTVRTRQLVRNIMGEQVVTFVDSSSSHNFINSTLISKLQLPVDYSINLKVKVANGQSLSSEGMCRTMKMKVQGTLLQPPLHLLDFTGCDVVFGVQ